MNRWISVAAVMVVVISVGVLIANGPPVRGVEQLREVLLSWGAWAVIISAGLMIAQAIIAPLPANVITITNGLVFGPIWGSLLSWFSLVLGSSICFLLSKTFGKPFAVRFAGKSIEKAEDFFNQYGLQAVFLVRIMPFVPFDAVSFGAGIVGIPYRRFLLATSVGIIPSVLVYSYIGSRVTEAYWLILVAALSVSLIGFGLASRFWRRQIAPAIQ
jgi:uncharacterized membrane protein YdjX (TVP38/TMEM64 family)